MSTRRLACADVEQARLNQEIARQGFLPGPAFLASSKPFNAPLGGLIVHYTVLACDCYSTFQGGLFIHIRGRRLPRPGCRIGNIGRVIVAQVQRTRSKATFQSLEARRSVASSPECRAASSPFLSTGRWAENNGNMVRNLCCSRYTFHCVWTCILVCLVSIDPETEGLSDRGGSTRARRWYDY